MDDFRILDNVELTAKHIRQWAYDENLFLMEQDEDLLLHDTEYVPLLLELASEPDCPKNDYVASILGYYAQNLFLFRHHKKLDSIANDLGSIEKSNPRIEKFASYFESIYILLTEPRPLQSDETEELARKLLVGIDTTRDFKCTNNFIDEHAEFMCYTQSYRGYVYIHSLNCTWVQSRHQPLGTIGE